MIPRTTAAGLLLLFAASPLFAQAAPAPDPLLDHLVGHWVLEGSMARSPHVVHDVTAEWVLGHEYVRVHKVSRERAANGAPAYEAIVYVVHDPHTGQYGAQWMDNTDYNAFDPIGVGRAPGAEGDSIHFVWHYSATTGFHNTFVYDRAHDQWQWHLDNDDRGARRPFARVTLTRAGADTAVAVMDDRLYFGRGIPGGGTVSDSEWNRFVDEVITPRFPAGFSLSEGWGQWRDLQTGVIGKEQGMTFEVHHPASQADDDAITAIALEYKRRFHQQAVLRATTPATMRMY